MGISKHDKQALSQLFIDMGVPLIVAMQTVESWSGDVPDTAAKAKNLAKLLNVTVDFATKITKKLEIRDSYTLENVRGKIIKIVTPIIAESYVSGGETPTEDAVKDLSDLFDVLISFSDSVSPTEDDKTKPHHMAQMIEACEPLIATLKTHSFGFASDIAFNKIMGGLKGRADDMAESLGIENTVESGLMKAIVKTYVSCYQSLIAKTEAGQDISGDAALDAIWAECDERMALIRGLTSYVGTNVGIEVAKPSSPKKETPKKEGKPAKDTEEKPSKDYFFNAGIYALDQKILKMLKKNQRIDMPDLIQKSIKKGLKINAFYMYEDWVDYGSKETFLNLRRKNEHKKIRK